MKKRVDWRMSEKMGGIFLSSWKDRRVEGWKDGGRIEGWMKE